MLRSAPDVISESWAGAWGFLNHGLHGNDNLYVNEKLMLPRHPTASNSIMILENVLIVR